MWKIGLAPVVPAKREAGEATCPGKGSG